MIGLALYNTFLHPLRSFPGPRIHAATKLAMAYYNVVGTLPFHIKSLHDRYGPVVRIAPNELAFCSPQAWKDIYSHRTAGQAEFSKDHVFYRFDKDTPADIIASGREEHRLLRRQIAHGFSERTMRGQEPAINDHVGRLIEKLRGACADSEEASSEGGKGSGGTATVNMREWFNWTTFDVIGDLGFNSKSRCLEEETNHRWASIIPDSIREDAYMRSGVALGLRALVAVFMRWGLVRMRREHQDKVSEQLRNRIEKGADVPDLIGGLLGAKGLFVGGLLYIPLCT